MTLEKRVGSQAEVDASKQSAAKWKQLGSAMSVGGDALANIAKVAGFLGVPFSEVARSMGEAVKTAGGQTKEAAASLEAATVHSLSDIKADLRAAMEGLDRTVLVVLDDIDRLSATEMALFFQLVKVKGDLPNLVYLLLFQRDIVEASLNKVAPKESGADYLDKIVQLPLNLPAISARQIFDLLRPDLVRILDEQSIDAMTTPEGRSFTQMHTGQTGTYFQRSLLSYFETVRDARRFINTLEFQADILRRDGGLQANAFDLMAMELLRVFEPDVYDGISANKDLFTIDPRRVYDTGEFVRARLEEITLLARNKDRVTEIIKRHFPNLAAAAGHTDNSVGGPNDADRAHLQVRHPDCFDRYFQLVIPEAELSQREVLNMKETLADTEATAERLIDMHGRGLLPEVIKAWMFRQEILDSREKIKQAFLALATVAELLPPPGSGAPHWLEMFVNHSVIRANADAVSVDFALECAQGSTAIYLPSVIYASLLEGLRVEDSPLGILRFRPTAKDLEHQVSGLLRGRMRTAADSGALLAHSRRAELIRYWAAVEGAEAQAVVDWLDTALADNSRLFAFFEGLVRPSRKRPDQIDADLVWDLSYLPLRRAVQRRLDSVKLDDLSDEQANKVRAISAILAEADSPDPLNIRSQPQSEATQDTTPAGLADTVSDEDAGSVE